MPSVLNRKKSDFLGAVLFLLLINLSAVYVHSAYICPSCIYTKKYVRLLQPELRQDKEDAALVSSYGMPQVFLEGFGVKRVRYGHVYWNNFLTRETIQNYFGTEDVFEPGPDYQTVKTSTAFDCKRVHSRIQEVIKMEGKHYLIDSGLKKIHKADHVFNYNNVHVFDEDNRIFKQLNEQERGNFNNKLISTVNHMNAVGKPLLDLDFKVVKASPDGTIYGFKGGARVIYKKMENPNKTVNHENFRDEVKLRKAFMSPRTDWVVIYPFEDEFDKARELFVEYNDAEKEENRGKRFAYKHRGDIRAYQNEEEDKAIMNDTLRYAADYSQLRNMVVKCVGPAVGYTTLFVF